MKASIRPQRVGVRSHPGGSAARMGQGVQPQPLDRLPPQRERSRRGEPNHVGPRQRARRPKAPSVVWGAQPRAPSEARLPPLDSRSARVTRAAGQGRASSPAPKAKTTGSRSGTGDAASDGGSRACAAPPRARQRRALEAAGREGAASRPGGASSPATAGESALAD